MPPKSKKRPIQESDSSNGSRKQPKALYEDSYVLILRSDVPEYLQTSAFFLELNENDNSEFPVPLKCYKPDDSVGNAQRAEWLINSVEFWGMLKLPQPFVSYFVNRKKQTLKLVLSEKEKDHMLSRWKHILAVDDNLGRMKLDVVLELASEGIQATEECAEIAGLPKAMRTV